MMSGQEDSRRDALMRRAASAGYNQEDFRQSKFRENIASTPGRARRLVVLVGLLIVCLAVLVVGYVLLMQFAPK